MNDKTYNHNYPMPPAKQPAKVRKDFPVPAPEVEKPVVPPVPQPQPVPPQPAQPNPGVVYPDGTTEAQINAEFPPAVTRNPKTGEVTQTSVDAEGNKVPQAPGSDPVQVKEKRLPPLVVNRPSEKVS